MQLLPRRARSSALAALSLAVLASSSLGQSISYVNGSLATGDNSGVSWANAFRGPGALSRALDSAGSFSKVFVAEGTYFPTGDLDRSVSFEIRDGVRLFGGFRGGESSEFFRPARGLAPTILSGDLAQDDTQPFGDRNDNSYHVVRVATGESGRLDGFTVRGGHADDSASAIHQTGGGLLCEGDCSVVDCLFEDNFALLTGGAIHSSTAPLSVKDTNFFGNQAGNLVPTQVLDGGGAVYYAGPPTFSNDVVLDGCRFELNRSSGRGAALFLGPNGRVVNSVFYRNFGLSGSAIWVDAPSIFGARVVACTVSRNSTGIQSGFAIDGDVGSSVLAVSQSILWGNIAFPIDQASLNPGLLAEDSIVEGGNQGTGILDVDPLFVDMSAGNFELSPGSPAIDASSAVQLPQVARRADAEGRRRSVDDPASINAGPGGDFMDLGALERTSSISGISRECVPRINSTGTNSKVDAYGSASVSQNALTLTAVDLPQQAFGYFIISRTPGFVVNPGGSPGNLCIVGDIGRLLGPGQVQNSGTTGQLSISVDLAAIPTNTGFIPAEPGDTWFFQAWHRDMPAGGVTSFFTDAAFVTLFP